MQYQWCVRVQLQEFFTATWMTSFSCYGSAQPGKHVTSTPTRMQDDGVGAPAQTLRSDSLHCKLQPQPAPPMSCPLRWSVSTPAYVEDNCVCRPHQAAGTPSLVLLTMKPVAATARHHWSLSPAGTDTHTHANKPSFVCLGLNVGCQGCAGRRRLKARPFLRAGVLQRRPPSLPTRSQWLRSS